MRGKIWNFCYLDEGRRSPLLIYEIPLNETEECLSDRGSYPSNNALLRAMLINDGVSESLQSYYELVRDNDLLARGGFFYIENVFGWMQIKKRILSERRERKRLDQLSSGNIFPTGLSLEDVDRYYPS